MDPLSSFKSSIKMKKSKKAQLIFVEELASFYISNEISCMRIKANLRF